MRMPGLASAECIRRISESWPQIKTVVLSASEDRATIDSAVQAGASAYVLKSVGTLDIPALIRDVTAGQTRFHTPSDDGEAASGGPDAALTDRETTILAAVAGGKTTKAISAELWVTEHTVKFHLTNIYRKLGVSNRSGAVRYAFEHGLARSRS
jgi:DNA-binding NarL/FixJ family response regulator